MIEKIQCWKIKQWNPVQKTSKEKSRVNWSRVNTLKDKRFNFVYIYDTEFNSLQSTPVLLRGESHGWRSLVGCSPLGREEADMTSLSLSLFTFHFHGIGERNGNSLQCSCLENPRNGRAWWAAVSGVTQSRTRLEQLSSSSKDYIVSLQYFIRYKI